MRACQTSLFHLANRGTLCSVSCGTRPQLSLVVSCSPCSLAICARSRVNFLLPRSGACCFGCNAYGADSFAVLAQPIVQVGLGMHRTFVVAAIDCLPLTGKTPRFCIPAYNCTRICFSGISWLLCRSLNKAQELHFAREIPFCPLASCDRSSSQPVFYLCLQALWNALRHAAQQRVRTQSHNACQQQRSGSSVRSRIWLVP